MSKGFIETWMPALFSGLVLALFAVIGSALVGGSYMGTAERIAQNEKDALLRQLAAIVPPERYDNDLLQDRIEIAADESLGSQPITVYRVRKNGENVAAVLSPIIAPGYAGDILLVVGVYTDGTVAGVRVISHRETPGLGDKIEEKRTPWILGFAGKSLKSPTEANWAVKRDGGEFDQFTGATITPRVVVAAVKRTLSYFQNNQEQLFAPVSQPAPTQPASESGQVQ